MALLNRKTWLLSILLVACIFVSFYFVLFKKQEDFYIIENVEISRLKHHQIKDSIILVLKLKKKYIASSNSKKVLLGGSMEKGLGGLSKSDFSIKILGKVLDSSIVLNDFLIAKNINHDKNISSSLSEVYNSNLNLSQLLKDFNSNSKYTSGMKLDDVEIYFFLQFNMESTKSKLEVFKAEIKTSNLFKEIEIEN